MGALLPARTSQLFRENFLDLLETLNFKWGWIPVELITTRTGTTPEGSQWAKINLPKEADTGDVWAFKDLVEVPERLLPGDYVLSFRWDCLESPQIWSACANIKIE